MFISQMHRMHSHFVHICIYLISFQRNPTLHSHIILLAYNFTDVLSSFASSYYLHLTVGG